MAVSFYSKPPEVIERINRECKVLVLIRGLPGSGKTTLAKQILKYTSNVISVTDIISQDKWFLNDYFNNMSRNICETQAHFMMSENYSPIIVDNVHCKIEELSTYMRDAEKFGYGVEVVEPQTLWRFDVNELYQRTRSGASKESLREMLRSYERIGYDGEMLGGLTQLSVYDVLESEPPVFDFTNCKKLFKLMKRKTSRAGWEITNHIRTTWKTLTTMKNKRRRRNGINNY